MFKKTAKIIPIFYFLLFLSIWAMPFAASAADFSLDFLTEETSNPGEFVNNVYKFALGISGAAAFAVIIYGAILYTASAGNSSKQQEAKEWIKGAVFGVILLLAAYLILYTINPNLVDLTSPELKKPSIPEAVDLPNIVAPDSELAEFDIRVKDDSVDLNGIRYSVKSELKDLAQEIGGANIVITSGRDSYHASGEYSHSTGYKVDLRLEPVLNDYILANFTRPNPSVRSSDGAELYVSPFNPNAVYALEYDHWDVVVK